MVNMIPVTIGGAIKDNYVKGASNFSDTTQLHKITVPPSRRWWLYAICVNRDANATLVVRAYDASNEVILEFQNDAAATGRTMAPNNDNAELTCIMPIPLKAGWYLNFAFGAVQGANAQITALVVEVPA